MAVGSKNSGSEIADRNRGTSEHGASIGLRVLQEYLSFPDTSGK